MPTTTKDLVAEAKARVENLDVDSVARAVADGALLVDLRETSEREETGSIPGALHVPRGLLEFKADPLSPSHHADLNPAARTIVYCASGGRSALAAVTLAELGYVDVAHLDGGIAAWQAAGRPTEIVG
jgi:rhodanese-related sulfurtransferase